MNIVIGIVTVVLGIYLALCVLAAWYMKPENKKDFFLQPIIMLMIITVFAMDREDEEEQEGW